MAANDLGEAQTALERSEEAAEERGNDPDVAYEKAVALFELCRFKDAQEAFTRLLSDDEHGAHAHQHLGLLLEREGKVAEAELHFRKARELSPDDFPRPADAFRRRSSAASWTERWPGFPPTCARTSAASR